ncbi:hypothetical protein JHD46_08375 [Sulfurimonas sp. SAG-AH-194-C20]|nr:hypothetical protein [Sulfurimonas sp. SAG-AH-194-C20]
MLIKEAFADQEKRIFPIHTPADASTSALFISVQKENIDDLVKIACQEALDEFGIDFTVFSKIEVEEGLSKTAEINSLGSEVFLLPSIKKLPVIDRDTLLKSASVFFNNIDSLSIKDKIVGARRLDKFASDFSVSKDEISPIQEQLMMRSPSNLSKLAVYIGDRKELMLEAESDTSECDSLLQKIALKRLENGTDISYDSDFGTSIVSELMMLDKNAGIGEHTFPIMEVFNIATKPLVKEASIEDDVRFEVKTHDEIIKIAGVAIADMVCFNGMSTEELVFKSESQIHPDVFKNITE